MTTTLVTGAAGFIGFHVARELLIRHHAVVGVDNLDSYYDPALKQARLAQLAELENFSFQRLDLLDRAGLARLLSEQEFGLVIHLAAQPGVRHAQVNPLAYVDSNILGLVNLLEACRLHPPAHFVFASSSSVYGLSRRLPYSVHDATDHPASLYAATKKAGEVIVHSYSHLYGLPATGLRFFTVYGPWGRPDMAPIKFLDALYEGRPLPLYNHGRMRRDFTYIDDIVATTLALCERRPASNPDWDAQQPDPASSSAPYRLYNIGSHRPVPLMEFVAALERASGRHAETEFLPLQAGDVLETAADVGDTVEVTGLPIETPLAEGVARLVEWYETCYAGKGGAP